ncbi:MAG TPA: NINE protein [Mucilaginibacter sp.]|jgi:hypothetical protein
MDIFPNPYVMLSGMSDKELSFIQQMTSDLNKNQQGYFYMIYSGRRKSPNEFLLFTLFAFAGCSGVQRFIIGQIGLGLLFFFTGGFCLIGTIVDLINHKSLAMEYNEKMIFESYKIASMGH